MSLNSKAHELNLPRLNTPDLMEEYLESNFLIYIKEKSFCCQIFTQATRSHKQSCCSSFLKIRQKSIWNCMLKIIITTNLTTDTWNFRIDNRCAFNLAQRLHFIDEESG